MNKQLEWINPLKDESNPTSVINLLPGVIQNALRAIPEEVFELDINELEEMAKIGEIERRMRIAFWIEHERATRTGSPIVVANVYKGLSNMSNFYKRTITNSHRLAYILTPPEDYSSQLEDLLQLGLREERKILEMPLKTTRVIVKNGEEKTFEYVDSALAMVKHKIRESIQNRLQGMPVHRSMQVNRNISDKSSTDPMMSLTGLPTFTTEELASKSKDELKDILNQMKQEKLPEAPSKEADDRDVIEIEANGS